MVTIAFSGGNRARGTASQGIPAWVLDSAVDQIVEISGTTHAGSSADPTDDPQDAFCRSNKRLSYGNVSIAGTELVLAATGGHGDYSGNEVTGIDLASDFPSWTLRKARTTTISNNVDTNTDDDTPTSRHHYNSTHYSTTLSRLMLHRTRAVYADASGSGRSFGYNLSNDTWDASTTYGTSNQSAGCRDSSDNCWSISNDSGHHLYKWTPATNTWAATYTNGAGTGPGNTIVYDSVNDRLFAVTWGNGEATGTGTVASIYTSGGTVKTDLSVTGAGVSAFEASTPAYASLVFDPDGERFLFLAEGATTIYQMTISGTTLTITALSTTGSSLPASVYSHGRMAYVSQFKAVVFMPAGNANLYAMRVA